MFFFPETYALRDRMATRYPHLRFENRGTTLTRVKQAELYGDALWVSDPDRCCQLRKVDPMRGALAGVEVWITGITRGQSGTRADTPLIGWDWQFQLLKINPLVQWDRKRVWEYVQANDVPYNPLHERGYPSIGCIQCTKPVTGLGVSEYTRLGRWDNTDKTECGLHSNGSGI
jgi:phosphoadenosine phosphosulfate reductase